MERFKELVTHLPLWRDLRGWLHSQFLYKKLWIAREPEKRGSGEGTSRKGSSGRGPLKKGIDNESPGGGIQEAIGKEESYLSRVWPRSSCSLGRVQLFLLTYWVKFFISLWDSITDRSGATPPVDPKRGSTREIWRSAGQRRTRLTLHRYMKNPALNKEENQPRGSLSFVIRLYPL